VLLSVSDMLSVFRCSFVVALLLAAAVLVAHSPGAPIAEALAPRDLALRRGLGDMRVSRECVASGLLESNQTLSLVRCALARNLDGTDGWRQQWALSPESLEQNAELHTREMWNSSDKLQKQLLTEYKGCVGYDCDTTLTFRYMEDAWELTKPGKHPRIFRFGNWDPICAPAEKQINYRYALESWFYMQFIGNFAGLVDDPQAADFVYLPFCIRFLLEGFTEQELSSGRSVTYLNYEGNFVEAAVRRVDDYLFSLVQRLSHMPEYAQCVQRKGCRFLVVSIDSPRNVYTKFAAAMGEKVTFVTYMGMSGWAPRQPGNLYWTDLHNMSLQGDVEAFVAEDEVPDGCRAACKLHCRQEPAAIEEATDIVLPWSQLYQWTRRSEQRSSRNLLAFFAGGESSCSRKVLLRVFEEQFVTDIRRCTLEPFSKWCLRGSTLVFPASVRLEQRMWSELAYRSQICLVPDGDCAMSIRLIEVIMHGCVPMIITNRMLPPFHEYIKWREIAFFVREDEIPILPKILDRIAREPAVLGWMQRRLRETSRHFDYTLIATGTLSTLISRRALSFRLPEYWSSR